MGPSGMIPRRSTTLYEKTSSTEKTNVLPAESKYDHRHRFRPLVLIILSTIGTNSRVGKSLVVVVVVS